MMRVVLPPERLIRTYKTPFIHVRLFMTQHSIYGTIQNGTISAPTNTSNMVLYLEKFAGIAQRNISASRNKLNINIKSYYTQNAHTQRTIQSGPTNTSKKVLSTKSSHASHSAISMHRETSVLRRLVFIQKQSRKNVNRCQIFRSFSAVHVQVIPARLF